MRAGLLHPCSDTMDPCYNHTSSQKSMGFPLQVVVGFCLVILIMITLCGNIIVCLAVTLDRRLRSLTNCIIVSLAITDLLLGLLVLPFSAFYELTKEWPFGSVLCNIYTSLDVMLCTASILNLLMISLDRYFAVTTPLRYRQVVTPSRVAVGLAVIWTVSLMVSFLPIHLGWNTNGTAVQNTGPTCSKECTLAVNLVYGLVDGLLTFYIPLGIMCITYYRILKIARGQAKRINHTWGNAPMPPMVKEHKATVTLAVVLGAFIVCWFPYFTMFTYRGVWGDSGVKGTPMSIVLWLGYANSALNPILYGTLNRDFRVAYQHLLHCWRTGHPRNSHLPPLQKAQPRGRQGQGRQEGKPLKLEVRNEKGTLLTDGALKRIPALAPGIAPSPNTAGEASARPGFFPGGWCVRRALRGAAENISPSCLGSDTLSIKPHSSRKRCLRIWVRTCPWQGRAELGVPSPDPWQWLRLQGHRVEGERGCC
ncbi:histamine H2 receptor isoform X1 [Vidua macroura]|uniref:histamine H2 receptor isoform X1 n=1 Tax=Vidua macroura TaxID=187451 RepID=UPI0023A7EAEF|nr:histamine H2 receptor isoform X1 [Vidua macroura]